MKLPCEMIQDLLPLYHDGVCSEVSKTVVQEHLKTCDRCTWVLKDLNAEIKMPTLCADEAKPLKTIKKQWNKKSWLKGILIGLVVFILVFFLWFELTQSCSVQLTAQEYTAGNVYRMSNGMYYLEFHYPYTAISDAADIHRSDDGSIHFIQYRARFAKKLDPDRYSTKHFLIDPDNNALYTDTGKQVALTAFYLGCPDKGDAILLWSTDMDIPPAPSEIEDSMTYYGWVFR